MYHSGKKFGLPESCRVHEFANIAGHVIAGENCRIDAFTTITGRVELGNNVHIGVSACIFGGFGVKVGSGVSISPGAKLFTATEDMKAEFPSNPQLKSRCFQSGNIEIGDFSVIGANSVVLPNVKIGSRAQIGCLSLVNKPVADDAIAAGVPVKQLGTRKLKQEAA